MAHDYRGPEKSRAIPAFHAFTGCDNVEGFYGIGKKTAWNALDLQPDALPALLDLSDGKINISALSDIVIAMYSP
ncbi:Tripartite motif-containing protein 5 [Frankliniella fusca]|uniref:Tripartite motif-containing protein 5 n=1 Tax=Frankliniella fusca TaxID=407009 RepID=A0AAE1H6H6_9NEOP|nr:Tripartite motif-containing protein 5 [Frankliniella fusca]